ncbi:hypothetical protein EMIT0111MI5_160073 [Burkholderia sp. IT-111MI5]
MHIGPKRRRDGARMRQSRDARSPGNPGSGGIGVYVWLAGCGLRRRPARPGDDGPAAARPD